MTGCVRDSRIKGKKFSGMERTFLFCTGPACGCQRQSILVAEQVQDGRGSHGAGRAGVPGGRRTASEQMSGCSWRALTAVGGPVRGAWLWGVKSGSQGRGLREELLNPPKCTHVGVKLLFSDYILEGLLSHEIQPKVTDLGHNLIQRQFLSF